MKFRIFLIVSIVIIICMTIMFSGDVVSPTSVAEAAPAAIPTPASGQTKTAFTGYKGVMIGTPMADARTKLGEPREKSDQQDYFVISEGETVQVVYDSDRTVITISTSYFGPKVTPPAAKDIFGTEVEANAEGAINKLIKYAKAGYWISYVRTAGADPMVMITVQKMSKDE